MNTVGSAIELSGQGKEIIDQLKTLLNESLNAEGAGVDLVKQIDRPGGADESASANAAQKGWVA